MAGYVEAHEKLETYDRSKVCVHIEGKETYRRRPVSWCGDFKQGGTNTQFLHSYERVVQGAPKNPYPVCKACWEAREAYIKGSPGSLKPKRPNLGRPQVTPVLMRLQT